MERRTLIVSALVVIGLFGLGWYGAHRPRPAVRLHRQEPPQPVARRSSYDRVIFVCRDQSGAYSPGIYVQGADGGGPAMLVDAVNAAPFMRLGDITNSSAGLCGFLFRELGPEAATGGGISLHDSPKPDADGKIDWQAYCSWNVDVVLIDVDHRTAECYSSPEPSDKLPKRRIGRVTDLPFGGGPEPVPPGSDPD